MAREWRAKNSEHVKKRRLAYAKKNRARIRKRQREWREKSGYSTSPARLAQNRKDWLRKYGLSPAQFDSLLAAQNGVCAICGSAHSRMKNAKRLYVDHCHVTNMNRGLLCFRCNSLLGNAGDSLEVLRSAIQYLERARDRRGSVC
jgi:hypothetical protein